MTRNIILLSLLSVACVALCCGCPADQPTTHSDPKNPPVETLPGEGSTPKESPERTGDEGDVPDSGETAAGPAGPAGPVGPARPADRRIPTPEEGRAQTDLLPTRELKVGPVALEAWIAEHEDSRRLGLMHVKEMAEERGMLFVYPGVRRRSFWMKNTLIPLSLAYIRSDGTIEQILDMQPLDLSSHPSTTAVKFVLEVNQGWFARQHVEVGMKVEGIEDLRGY